MLFNSIEFAIFSFVIFALYWFATKKSYKLQNILLLFASCFFYGWWDWRFLLLLAISTSFNYLTGLRIASELIKKRRLGWFLVTIVTNITILGIFKYYNFFIESFIKLSYLIGFQAHLPTLKLILPLGISFYTFHGLSYIIDLYNKKILPEKNYIHYSLFVCYFPLLTAGPIERATHLLPQINRPRIFDYNKATDGLRQILWGLFKKIVIADNCAVYVNDIFTNYQIQSGSTLLLGAILFAFQIYGDFSGYTDIAIGTSRLFGIELLRNFAFPYFSRDIAEFWRRWHISLTTWFRDYLYIPLGGSHGHKWQSIRNTFIIFLVSGFWHGANWTYIIWGAYHTLLFIPLLLLHRTRRNLEPVAQGKIFPELRDIAQITVTFFLVVFGWIIFRAETIEKAFLYISGIFSFSLFSLPHYTVGLSKTFLVILIMLAVEWVQREKKHGLEISRFNNRYVRWTIYYSVILIILELGAQSQTFIYFQF